MEKLEEILEEKLRKVIQLLSKRIEDAMQSANTLKYDQIVKTMKGIRSSRHQEVSPQRKSSRGELAVRTRVK